MKLFPEEPVFVVGEAGFDTVVDGQKVDLLGRKPLGQKLTDLVDRIDQPLVIALDGGWGSGKSHFLKLWAGAHAKELGGKAEVVYFDAFEHDFLDDPLVSLISRLTVESAEKTWDAKAIGAVKRAAIPLAKIVARVGLAVGTAGASEVANALGDAAIGKLADVTDASIDQFWKAEASRITAMQGFRRALTDLTAPKADGGNLRKIVFIVDELDRCRPDYALSMLEIIKHFFAVPNVHFVLGANLAALENSIRARYGSGTDAQSYLQKFIRIRMSLPSTGGTAAHQAAGLNLFGSFARELGIKSEAIESFKAFARLCPALGALTLRDAQHLASYVALLSTDASYYFLPKDMLCKLATFARATAPNLYKRIREGTVQHEEVCDFLGFSVDGRSCIDQRQKFLWSCFAVMFSEIPSFDIREFAEKNFGAGWGDGATKRDWVRQTIREDVDTFWLPAARR